MADLTLPQRHPLPCGCTVVVSHERGEIRVRCAGSDGVTPEGVLSISRNGLQKCKGGRYYVVKAIEVRTIRYDSRPVTVPGGDSAA